MTIFLEQTEFKKWLVDGKHVLEGSEHPFSTDDVLLIKFKNGYIAGLTRDRIKLMTCGVGYPEHCKCERCQAIINRRNDFIQGIYL